MSVHLQQRGYRTMFVGKYLNGYEKCRPYHGLIRSGTGPRTTSRTPDTTATDSPANGTLVQYGTQPEDYITDVIAEKTVDFIERSEADDDRPFFTMVTPTAPHFPLAPAPRHAGNEWTDAQPPRTPNFYEADLSDKPWWLQASGDSRDQTRDWNTWDHRNRMGSLLAVDEMVADIVDALERTGELDRTVIVWASDNGYNLGSHRLVHKMAPYEESIRVPLVISGPEWNPAPTTTWSSNPTGHRRCSTSPGCNPSYMDVESHWHPCSTEPTRVRGATTSSPSTRGVRPSTASGRNSHRSSTSPPACCSWPRRSRATRRFAPGTTCTSSGSATSGAGWQATELYDLDSDPYQLDNLLATPEGRADNAQLVTTMHVRPLFPSAPERSVLRRPGSAPRADATDGASDVASADPCAVASQDDLVPGVRRVRPSHTTTPRRPQCRPGRAAELAGTPLIEAVDHHDRLYCVCLNRGERTLTPRDGHHGWTTVAPPDRAVHPRMPWRRPEHGHLQTPFACEGHHVAHGLGELRGRGAGPLRTRWPGLPDAPAGLSPSPRCRTSVDGVLHHVQAG